MCYCLYGLLILRYVVVKGFSPCACMLGLLIVKAIVYWRRCAPLFTLVLVYDVWGPACPLLFNYCTGWLASVSVYVYIS